MSDSFELHHSMEDLEFDSMKPLGLNIQTMTVDPAKGNTAEPRRFWVQVAAGQVRSCGGGTAAAAAVAGSSNNSLFRLLTAAVTVVGVAAAGSCGSGNRLIMPDWCLRTYGWTVVDMLHAVDRYV
jgi:hypothetical protein